MTTIPQVGEILKDLDLPASNRTRAAVGEPVAISGREVQCATLIYGGAKQSKCFANQFLADLSKNTNVRTQPQFVAVRIDAQELFRQRSMARQSNTVCTVTGSSRTGGPDQQRAPGVSSSRKGMVIYGHGSR